MLERCLFLLVLVSPTHSYSWFDLGHQVVGQIAWQHLNATTRSKVTELLSHISPIYKEASSLSTAATIPDHLRSGLKTFDTWHYVTIPYMTTAETPPPPLTTPNAIWALCEGVRTLGTTKSKTATDPFGFQPKPFEKAFMLAFFAHLVGDIHQPLHATSRFTRFLPEGDQGGNRFPVRLGSHVTNLHLYWDSGLGFFSDVSKAVEFPNDKFPQTDATADAIMKEFPRSYFGARVEQVSFTQWAQDSFEVAKKVVYDLTEGSEPSAAYVARGQKVVKERVALAGYRLAYLLNSLLSENGASQLATGCIF